MLITNAMGECRLAVATIIRTRSDKYAKPRSIIRPSVKIDWRPIINPWPRIDVHRRPTGDITGLTLIHIEVDALRDAVFRAEHMAGSEDTRLGELIGGNR